MDKKYKTVRELADFFSDCVKTFFAQAYKLKKEDTPDLREIRNLYGGIGMALIEAAGYDGDFVTETSQLSIKEIMAELGYE